MIADRLADPSSWYVATQGPGPDAAPIDGDVETDVCVVGGGYTGLGAALHLARAGVAVRLVEQARIGWGASGRNGGQVHVAMRRDQRWLETHLGEEAALGLWRIALAARDHLDWAIDRYAIDCAFTPGLLHLDHKRRYVPHSRDTVAHMRDRYGYEALSFVDRDRARALVASESYHGGMLDARGGHLHALDWALGLARAAQAEGARLHDRTRVTAITPRGAGWALATPRGRIRARRVIVAANGYLDGLLPAVEARVMPINNFIAVTEPLGRARAEALIRDRLAVSDSRFVVYYFRLTGDDRLLFGGGENYSYRQPRDIAGFVRPHLLRVFPQLADVRLDHGWGGTLAITPNRLPFVRCPAPGMTVIAGFCGLGVMLAPYFGKLAADALTGGSADFDRLLALPSRRFPGGRALRWATLAAAMSFFALRDRL